MHILSRLCTPSSPAVFWYFEHAFALRQQWIWRIQQQKFVPLSTISLLLLSIMFREPSDQTSHLSLLNSIPQIPPVTIKKSKAPLSSVSVPATKKTIVNVPRVLGKIRFFDSISSIIGQKVREKNKDPGDLLVAILIDLIEIFWHNKDDCAVIHWRKLYPVYSQSCLLEQVKLLKNVSLVHQGNCVACQEYTLGRLCTPNSPAVSRTFERASVSRKHGIWRIQQQHFEKLSTVNLVQLFFWPELTFNSSEF